jgi:transposase
VVEGRAALWFGASGFGVLDVVDDGVELEVQIQTVAAAVGCSTCGTRARPKDRRWVTRRDAPSGDRAVRLRWRKRVWSCPDADCDAKTWTEGTGLAEPRRVLTARAAEWATDRVAALEGTPASIAHSFGMSWSTVWSVVERVGRQRFEDPDRIGPQTVGEPVRIRSTPTPREVPAERRD